MKDLFVRHVDGSLSIYTAAYREAEEGERADAKLTSQYRTDRAQRPLEPEKSMTNRNDAIKAMQDAYKTRNPDGGREDGAEPATPFEAMQTAYRRPLRQDGEHSRASEPTTAQDAMDFLKNAHKRG